MPVLALSATSWKVPLLIPYVAMRRCCIDRFPSVASPCVLAPRAEQLGPVKSERHSSCQAFAEKPAAGRIWRRIPWILDSPVRNGGRVHQQYAQHARVLSLEVGLPPLDHKLSSTAEVAGESQ